MSVASNICAGIDGRVWPCVAHFVKPSRLLQFFGKSSDGNHISIWAWWLSRLNTSRAWLKKHQLHCISLWNGMLETFSASGGKHTQNLHRWWMCLWFWLYILVQTPIYRLCWCSSHEVEVKNHKLPSFVIWAAVLQPKGWLKCPARFQDNSYRYDEILM